MNKLKIVKTIVFLLTFLLIFGIISAGMIIVKRAKQTDKLLPELNLQQPVGSHIADYKFNDGKLYILLKGKRLSDRIIVIDSSSQTILTTIKTF